MLLAVDVGNSAVKLGVFDGSRLCAFARLPGADLPSPGAVAAALPPEFRSFDAVAAVSVSEPGLAALEASLDQPVLVLGRDLPVLVAIDVEEPSEVGRDRLVNAAAAHHLAGGAAVAADLGSAVTVDAVSAQGAFLGGSIGPGLRALAAGLAGAAPALPEWDEEELADGLPRGTRAAIRAGVVLGMTGLVERLVATAAAALPSGAPVYLTGGDAVWVVRHLTAPVRPVPHLTLEGVRLLYDRAGRPPCT